ncbi:substance-P receptor-like [Paramuricea clavata]|uniref:Substance-P receptor-like n=1 Tax=Paramuricea clavata TaxID=317549 RepID=A0A6S7I837_PARCT|nr:substance-P receptor-like [Paramuricea clavata]
MGEMEYDVFIYSITAYVLSVFGILGNILVVISILNQRYLLKSNYYILVLQLAICDLGVLTIYLLEVIVHHSAEEPHFLGSVVYCIFGNIFDIFQVAGVGMMLIISVLRYRATVHPLRPAISRRKLKVFCGLVYIVGFIVGFGTYLSFCFVELNFYRFIRLSIGIVIYSLLPTIFMAVVYYKIGRALLKQSRHMKRVCPDAVRRRHIRDRRTFLVCLGTVLCFGIGSFPISGWYIFTLAHEYNSIKKYVWMESLGVLLRVAGSYLANPVIYGILDRKLLTFWKHCRKKTLRPQEQPVICETLL